MKDVSIEQAIKEFSNKKVYYEENWHYNDDNILNARCNNLYIENSRIVFEIETIDNKEIKIVSYPVFETNYSKPIHATYGEWFSRKDGLHLSIVFTYEHLGYIQLHMLIK